MSMSPFGRSCHPVRVYRAVAFLTAGFTCGRPTLLGSSGVTILLDSYAIPYQIAPPWSRRTRSKTQTVLKMRITDTRRLRGPTLPVCSLRLRMAAPFRSVIELPTRPLHRSLPRSLGNCKPAFHEKNGSRRTGSDMIHANDEKNPGLAPWGSEGKEKPRARARGFGLLRDCELFSSGSAWACRGRPWTCRGSWPDRR
jgi:hypothetical protein